MKKTFAVIAASGALLAGCAAPAPVTAPAPLPACPEEDYAGPVACRWDAGARGNGAGLSFTWDGAGTISYAAPGLDAELQKCADIFPVETDGARYEVCYETQLTVAASGLKYA